MAPGSWLLHPARWSHPADNINLTFINNWLISIGTTDGPPNPNYPLFKINASLMGTKRAHHMGNNRPKENLKSVKAVAPLYGTYKYTLKGTALMYQCGEISKRNKIVASLFST